MSIDHVMAELRSVRKSVSWEAGHDTEQSRGEGARTHVAAKRKHDDTGGTSLPTAKQPRERSHASQALFTDIMALVHRLREEKSEQVLTVGGWKASYRIRGGHTEKAGRGDICFYGPDGQRLRSVAQLEATICGDVHKSNPPVLTSTPKTTKPSPPAAARHEQAHHASRKSAFAKPLAKAVDRARKAVGECVASRLSAPPVANAAASQKSAEASIRALKRRAAEESATGPAQGGDADEEIQARRAEVSSRRTAASLLRSFRADLAGPVVVIGDSIAEELASNLRSTVGLQHVSWCAKRGAVPCDIEAHLAKWLERDEHLALLRRAGLLIVCAGKNLLRTTPSLIAVEVHKHLIEPLNKIYSGPAVLVGPLTRDIFQRLDLNRTGAGAGAARRPSGQSNAPTPHSSSEESPDEAEEPTSSARLTRVQVGPGELMAVTNQELGGLARRNGFAFVDLFTGSLTEGDFRDNLHLSEAGYLKLLSAVYDAWSEETGRARAHATLARSGREQELAEVVPPDSTVAAPPDTAAAVPPDVAVEGTRKLAGVCAAVGLCEASAAGDVTKDGEWGGRPVGEATCKGGGRDEAEESEEEVLTISEASAANMAAGTTAPVADEQRAAAPQPDVDMAAATTAGTMAPVADEQHAAARCYHEAPVEAVAQEERLQQQHAIAAHLAEEAARRHRAASQETSRLRAALAKAEADEADLAAKATAARTAEVELGARLKACEATRQRLGARGEAR